MALQSEYGSKKKMAEGGNEAELLKEKANNYFKGRFSGLVRSAPFNRCLRQTLVAALNFVSAQSCCRLTLKEPVANGLAMLTVP